MCVIICHIDRRCCSRKNEPYADVKLDISISKLPFAHFIASHHRSPKFFGFSSLAKIYEPQNAMECNAICFMWVTSAEKKRFSKVFIYNSDVIAYQPKKQSKRTIAINCGIAVRMWPMRAKYVLIHKCFGVVTWRFLAESGPTRRRRLYERYQNITKEFLNSMEIKIQF